MLKSIINMRAEAISNTEIHSKKYRKLLTESLAIDKKIQALIPEDKQNDYYKLSNEMFMADSEVSSIEVKESYKQGFYDGLEIALLLLKLRK